MQSVKERPGPSADIPDDLAHHVHHKYFSSFSRRRALVICQLPLTVALVLVAVAVSLVSPQTLGNPLFQSFLVLGTAIMTACALVPWTLLPAKSFVVIPLVDFVLIGVAREATTETISSLGLLLVFPVIWLSAALGKTGVGLSFIGTSLVAAAPVLAGSSAAPADIVRPFLLPAIMTVIALSVHVLVSSISRQDARLKEKDATLREAYAGTLARERLLNTVLDTVGVGVHAVDSNGKDILMNHRQRRNHLLAAPPDILDASEPQLAILEPDGVTPVPPERRPVARAARGQSFSNYRIRIATPTRQRVLSATARPMNDEYGNFTGSVVAFSDVTDLVEALAIKDDFVATVSHEFRTPLMSILGFLDLILESPEQTPGQHADFLGTAQSNAERLLQLVSDLLATGVDSMAVHPQHIDLADLAAMSMASAAPRADKAGVALINDVAGSLWLTADPGRVSQVLDNLLSNAIKYSRASDTVTLRAWATPEMVCLSVTDTGIGIAEDDIGQVFTKYYRSGRVRESRIPGVGLGLGIVKTIMDNHGGSIAVSSKLNRGSTFTVTFPTINTIN